MLTRIDDLIIAGSGIISKLIYKLTASTPVISSVVGMVVLVGDVVLSLFFIIGSQPLLSLTADQDHNQQ